MKTQKEIMNNVEDDSKSDNDTKDYKFVILKSNDNLELRIAKNAAKAMTFIQPLLDDDSDNEDEEISEVPIQKVRGKILAKVVDFCNQHYKDPMPEIMTPIRSCDIEELVPAWYANYIKEMDWKCLQELVLAAHFMDVTPLIRLSVLAVSLHINMKTVDEIKTLLAITYDMNKKSNVDHRDVDEEQNLWRTHYINAELSSTDSHIP